MGPESSGVRAYLFPKKCHQSFPRQGNLGDLAPPPELSEKEGPGERGHVRSRVQGILESSSHEFYVPQQTCAEMLQNTGLSNYVRLYVGR